MITSFIRRLVGFFIVSSIMVVFSISYPAFAYAADKDAPPPAMVTPDKDSKDKDKSLQETDVSRFTNTIALINEFYVKPISEQKLLEDAIRGIVAGLDPHSEYLDQDAYRTLLMETSGEFGGIGIEVMGEYDVLKVISPVDDTPAAKAGIKPGDYIVAINDKMVNNMSLNEAVDAIHGKKGTQITLTILRKGAEKPLKFTLTRDMIHIDAVKSKMLNNNVGYIRISQFQETTPTLTRQAIESLQKSTGGKLKGLVIDLRNNPGGLLDSAVKVVDLFLDSKNLHSFKKLIVYTQGHLPQLQYEAKATGDDIVSNAPIIVLINEGSASASEIVAGALQDYRRAVIVGTTSFGKGSVQTVIPLDKTHALKLTTALYYTPAGRQIQNKGIIPDVAVENFKVTSNNPDALILGPIREYELKNHLKSQANAPSVVVNTGDYSDIATQDFQLYEALKILQAIYTVDNKIQS